MSGGGGFAGRRGFGVEGVENGKKGEGLAVKEDEGKKKTEKVPFLKLFAFADFWDYVLMGIGSLGACAHGASVPVFFIFFGKLINVMGFAYFFPETASKTVGTVNTSICPPPFLFLILLSVLSTLISTVVVILF